MTPPLDHPKDLFWYVSGNLTSAEAERVEAHLRDCAECRQLAATLEEWKSGVLSGAADAHPDPAELDDYLARRVAASPEDAMRLEAHISACAECRQDLEMLHGLIADTEPIEGAKGVRSPWSRSLVWAAGILLGLAG